MQAAANQSVRGSSQGFQDLSKNIQTQRFHLNNTIKSWGDVEARTMKSVSAAELYTKRIQEQKVTLGEAIRQQRLMNQVIKDQINLKNMQVASWSKNPDGKVVSDAYIPNSAVKGVDQMRMKMAAYNQVLGSVANNTIKWGKNTQWAGRQLTVGFAVPLAMVAAATGKLAFDMDKALTSITKVYGDATQQFQETTEDIRKASWNTAKNMTALYGQSAKDTLEITSQLAAAGGTGIELQNATAAATKARMLNEIDLQTAIKASITMQTAYKMSGQELGETWDYINAVANQTVLSAEDFAVAIPKVGGLLQELGADVKDLGVFMTAMVAGGVDAAEGANALKSIAFRAVAPYDKAMETFKKNTGANLQELITQANGKIVPLLDLMIDKMRGLDTATKTQVFKDVFGIHQGNKALVLMEQLANETGQVAQAMAVGKNSVAENAIIANQELERMNAQPYKKIEKAFQTIKNEMGEIGESILPPVTWALEKIGGLFNSISNMGTLKKQVLIFSGLLVAATGPALMLLGLFGNLAGQGAKFVSMLGGLILKNKLLTPEQKAQEILGKKVADSYNMQAQAAKNLAAVVTRTAETIAAANGMTLNSLVRATYHKTDPNKPMVYGPAMPPTTQTRGPDGKFQASTQTYFGGMTAVEIRNREKAYQQQVLAGAAARKLAVAEEQKNKALAVQRQRYAEVTQKMAGTVAAAGMLATMFGPNGGVIGGIANAAFALGMVATMANGAIAKVIQMGTTAVASSAVASRSIGFLRAQVTALGVAVKGAAIPFTVLATTVGLFWYKMGQEADNAINKVNALSDSTKAWAETLGYNRIDAGTLATQAPRTSADITALGVSQMAEKAPDLYAALSEKKALSEGEKWGEAIAQGASVRLSGGTAEAAKQATKSALSIMNAGITDAEFEATITTKIDFENMTSVAKARIDGIGTMIQEAVGKTADGGWEDTWDKMIGSANETLTKSGREMAKKSVSIFTETLVQTPTEDREALTRSFAEKFSGPIDDAYAEAGKKIGVSREKFLKLLLDYNKNGGGIANQSPLFKAFSQTQVSELARQAESQKIVAEGLADINGISYDISKGGDLTAVINEIIRLGGSARQVDGTPVARELEKIQEAANSLEETLKSMNITTEADAVINAYKDVMKNTDDSIFDFANEAWDEHVDNVMAGFEATADGIQASGEARQKAMEKRHDAEQEAMEKKNDAAQERMKNSQEAATKRLEATQKARRDAETAYYDNRIKKIEDTIAAEEKAEETRQKLFEAERERIRRYSEMFSKNVDLNAAITGGKFDDAAKIANDMQSQADNWALSDSQALNAGASQTRVEALSGQKDKIQTQKDARLQALDAIEKAETESLRKRQELDNKSLASQIERDKKSLASTQKTEKERLDAGIKAALAYNEKMKEFTQKEIDIDRKGLEKELENLKVATPTNEAELKAHHARVQQIYDAFGVDLTKKGDAWSGLIGTSLSTEVMRSTAKIANDKAWGTIGAQISEALLVGGFGMTPSEIGAWLNGGPAPAGSVFAGPKTGPTQSATRQSRGLGGAHKGGVISEGMGFNRTGHSGSQQNPSEMWINALKGESVLNRKATDMIGADGVNALNKGELPPNTGPWGPNAGFAGVAGAMTAALTKRIMADSINAIKNRLTGGPMDAMSAGKYGGIDLTPEQLANAGTIMNVGKSMGATSRDLQIGLMTALQESSLKNLRFGDRDSLGLFQQRPSQGWGTAEQILDPQYASRKFFSELLKVKDRNKMPMTIAAQKVQRSAFPNAYAKWENVARAILMGGASQYRGFGANIDISNLMGLSGAAPGAVGGWVRPAAGKVTSEFGPRGGRLHDGIDIANAVGTPLYAARSGVVTQTRFGSGVGNYTQIDHGNGYATGYAHQSKFLTSIGSMVQAGQRIGLMGNTGNSTGPHLHFRYIKDGIARNPRTIMPQLANGGYTLNEGLANLHPKETVLTRPLSEDLKSGLNKFGEQGGGGDTYRFDVNLAGAYISSDVVIERAVGAALEKKERKQGRKRVIG